MSMKYIQYVSKQNTVNVNAVSVSVVMHCD